MTRILPFMAAALLCALATLTSAHAQAARTWVSGVGDDANPCSRTAPCKTFPGAISKTAAGSEINVVDPGGYGAVTITKSIAIISESVQAGVLVSGTNAIIINALTTDTVTLRGLNIDGLTPIQNSLNGVKIMSAANVHISDCVIRGFNETNNGNAIQVAPTAANVKVVVNNCYISNNKHGVAVEPTGTGVGQVMISNSVIANNTGRGIRTNGANASAHVSNSVITGNATGLFFNAGGTIVSSGNNVIANNNTNGAPSTTLPLQ